MEIEVSNSNSDSSPLSVRVTKEEKERVRVKRETLQSVLEQCQIALELLSNGFDEDDDDDGAAVYEEDPSRQGSTSRRADREADEVQHQAFLGS